MKIWKADIVYSQICRWFSSKAFLRERIVTCPTLQTNGTKVRQHQSTAISFRRTLTNANLTCLDLRRTASLFSALPFPSEAGGSLCATVHFLLPDQYQRYPDVKPEGLARFLVGVASREIGWYF
jgi:hypothetical protein